MSSSNTPKAVYKIILIGDAGVGKTTCLAKFKEEYTRYKWMKIGTKYTAEEYKLESPTSTGKTQPTIGVEFESFDFTYPYKQVEEDKKNGTFERLKLEPSDGEPATLKVQIWDTAGQERYRAITKAHYRRANGVMLFFDTSDKNTFKNVDNIWWPEVRDAASDTTGLLSSVSLVQNKVDLWKVYENNLHDGFIKEEDLYINKFIDDNFPREDDKKRPNLHEKVSAITGKNVLDAFGNLINRIHKHHYEKNKGNSTQRQAVTNLQNGANNNKNKTCMCN